LPPAAVMPRVQLAICWNIRVSRATSAVDGDGAVKMRRVRTISRKGAGKRLSWRILRDCTPTTSQEVKIQSVLHGDMERPAEMTGPLAGSTASSNQTVHRSLVSNS
jgi:hypothetical protein